MEAFASTMIILGILYLIYLLKQHGVKLSKANIGVDNPYYDNKVNSIPLKKYEEELDKAFNYDNINITPLFEGDESNNISYSKKDKDLDSINPDELNKNDYLVDIEDYTTNEHGDIIRNKIKVEKR